MIRNSAAIILVLLAIEAAVLWLSGHGRSKRFFKFIPAVFWIYFLPFVASLGGLIDPASGVYQKISETFLPASLLLLLLATDMTAIAKLGRPALIMMMAGSLGIMAGTPLAFLAVRGHVGQEFWSGFGALSASWIGGSANMIAVKEAIGTPERVFMPMVIVDTVVPYAWMGFLISFAGLQPLYDKWNRSNRGMLDELGKKISGCGIPAAHKFSPSGIFMIFAVAVSGTAAARFAAFCLPEVKSVITAYTWTIITVSVMGILLSLTPARKLERAGSSKIGYFLLYFVLTSIGAKARSADMGIAAVLIMAGILIVLIHATVLILTARAIKAPMFLAAVASQANIGGVASAPILASIYEPGFASVGLLLAVMGNIIGTYMGIIVGQICLWLNGC